MKTLEDIQEALSDALQSDLENGVKWLNERAAREFAEKYKELNKVLTAIQNLETIENRSKL